METWKYIPGYEGQYQVSTLGNVRSFVLHKEGRLRALTKAKKGHVWVNLGRGTNFTVHTLVLRAFVGEPPFGMECCHNDGNPSNNALYNLRWDTRAENAKDMYRQNNHANQKLNTSKVKQIKEMLAKPLQRGDLSKIAKQYGVSLSAISCIKRKKTYDYALG